MDFLQLDIFYNNAILLQLSAIQHKQTQYCKSTILQWKTNLKNLHFKYTQCAAYYVC